MIAYRIKITQDRPLDFSRRDWKEVLRAGMREAGQYWHQEIMPKHFERSARARYGYQPRRDRYQGYKIRARGRGKAVDTVDLVFSGQTRSSALKPPLIKAYPTRARVDLLVPPYINMRPDPRGKRKAAPAMGDELTRVTYQESQKLSEVVRDMMESALDDHKAAAKRKQTAEYQQLLIKHPWLALDTG